MTPSELRDALSQRVLLLDGGLGSSLIAMGLGQGIAPEVWNHLQPDRVVSAHARFVDAGSDIIQTNTFGGTSLKLGLAGVEGTCRQVNQRAVDLARSAAGNRCWVAGDMGPSGLFLPPMGEAQETVLEQAYREQAMALAEAGVDLLSIETMYDLREAVAAVRAASATGLAVMCSMTFDVRRRGVFSMVGDPLTASLQMLAQAGATVVGFNCTVTADVMESMVAQARAALPHTPVVAQPNAGQPRPTPQGVVYDADPGAMRDSLLRMVDAGVSVVGGCCGTDERMIALMRGALDARAVRANAPHG